MPRVTGEESMDSREREWFVECYRSFVEKLKRYVERLIHDREAAEEIVQDIFTYLYSRDEVLRPDSPSIAGFLYRIARHRAIDYLRNSARLTIPSGSLEESVIDEKTLSNLEDMVCDGAVVDEIAEMIDEEDPVSREVIVRMMYHGQKARKICSEMSLTEYRVGRTVRDFSDRVKRKIGDVML